MQKLSHLINLMIMKVILFPFIIFSGDILIDMTLFRFGKIRKQTNSNCQHRMFKMKKSQMPFIHLNLRWSSVLNLNSLTNKN